MENSDKKKVRDWMSIAKFILIIIAIVTIGLFGCVQLLQLADTYGAVSDPCGTCEEITSLKCEPEYTGNLYNITIEESEGGVIEWLE